MMKNIFISLTAVLLFFLSVINQSSAQCSENFDGVTAPALPSGWSASTLTDCTGSNPWITSTTLPYNGTNSVFVTAPGCVSDEVFVSRPYSITSTSAELSFRRKHDLELNWDGLVLEISIGGGAFTDILAAGGIFTAGAYSVTPLNGIQNPIGGRRAWTGSTSNAFILTTVTLPASVIGKIVIFRWRRGTDESNSGAGVYIDNVSITGCSTSACAENFDGLTIPALPFGWISYTALDCATSNPWVTTNSLSQTAPNSAFVNSPDCISDEYLYSKRFQITSNSAQITFRRINNTELNYDGMVIEISIGGAPFKDVLAAGCTFNTGGYTEVIGNCCNSPIPLRSAWTGDSGGWVITTITLPASANGKSVVIRWRRATDDSVSGIGVNIDGLSISGSLCNPVCATNITLTPAGGSFCNSTQVLLTASVVAAVYEWYRDDVLINGVTGNTYTATTPGIYHVRSVISGCLAISNVAVLEAASVAPVITGGGVYCNGSTVNIAITTSDVTQKYIWKRDGIFVYGPVNGTGGALTYNFTMSAGGAGNYIVEATKAGCTTVVSNTVSVRLPDLITGLATVQVCPSEVTIKWNHLRDGINTLDYEYQISNSATPPASGTQTSDSVVTLVVNPSTLYYFYVRYKCSAPGTVNWTSISFTTPPNNLSLSPASGSVCNNTLQLTTAANGIDYEWYRNNVLIDGETSSTYNTSDAGTYRVEATINGCRQVSNNAVITATTIVAPIVDLGGPVPGQVTTNVYCTNATAEVRLTNSQPSQEYTWFRNGSSIGGNGGNQSLQLAVSSSTAGEYSITTSKTGCDDETSNDVDVIEARVTGLNTTAICSNQVSFSWNSVAFGENYQYVVDQVVTPPSNPVNPGTTSLLSATVSSLLPATTYHIHIRAASGPSYTSFCSTWTNREFTTPAANPILEWTGEVSTSWTNPANWTCGQVPVSTSEIIINGGKPNYPTITSNTTIKKLTVNSGATVNVQPGVTLTITSQ
jgi:hypothetical protein